jgi:hypothetical protein
LGGQGKSLILCKQLSFVHVDHYEGLPSGGPHKPAFFRLVTIADPDRRIMDFQKLYHNYLFMTTAEVRVKAYLGLLLDFFLTH